MDWYIKRLSDIHNYLHNGSTTVDELFAGRTKGVFISLGENKLLVRGYYEVTVSTGKVGETEKVIVPERCGGECDG